MLVEPRRLRGGGVVRFVWWIVLAVLVARAGEHREPAGVLPVLSYRLDDLIRRGHVRRELHDKGVDHLRLRKPGDRDVAHSSSKDAQLLGDWVQN